MLEMKVRTGFDANVHEAVNVMKLKWGMSMTDYIKKIKKIQIHQKLKNKDRTF